MDSAFSLLFLFLWKLLHTTSVNCWARLARTANKSMPALKPLANYVRLKHAVTLSLTLLAGTRLKGRTQLTFFCFLYCSPTRLMCCCSPSWIFSVSIAERLNRTWTSHSRPPLLHEADREHFPHIPRYSIYYIPDELDDIQEQPGDITVQLSV
jgi:hypothetical protein